MHILGRHLQLTHPGRLKRTGTPVGGEGGVKKGEGGLFGDFLARSRKGNDVFFLLGQDSVPTGALPGTLWPDRFAANTTDT